MNKKTTFAAAWRMHLRCWKIYWKLCPGIFVSNILHALFSAASTYALIWFSAQLINELAGARQADVLIRLVVWILAISALLAGMNAALMHWKNYERKTAAYMDERVLISKMLDLDFADLDSQYVFDLYYQIRQSTNYRGWGFWLSLSLFETLVEAAFQIIGGISLSVGLFLSKVPQGGAYAEILNHPLCVLTMIVLMLGVAVLTPACANAANSYWSKKAGEAEFGNRCFSFFGCISQDRKRAVDMRLYRQQENISDAFLDRNDMFGKNSSFDKAFRGPMGLWMLASESVSMVLTGIIYLFVCLKAWAGAFGPGLVTQYVGAITNLFIGISKVLRVAGELKNNSEFLKTTYKFLDIPNKMYQGSLTTEKRSDRQYVVEFKDVSFKYPGSDTYALRHVNMNFKVGSRLAIVGMNGSGKTTFIKLLCRLYDPTEGQILLNGIDIRKYRYDDYMDIFSVVFQDFVLAALPLGQNVAASGNYDRGRVEDCLKMAGFDERLARMEKGLDTSLYKDLDKSGVEISGGEAQKIAIARALYKDAPFIILDEPTAALDPVAEAEIYSRFNEIAGDKTAVYISHRLSSCKFCNEIAVFDNGSIVQQGSHDRLVADTQGKYFELWHAQAQYYAQ